MADNIAASGLGDIPGLEQEPLRLDYKLETPEDRTALVHKIIEQTPSEKLTPRYLEILADYIVFAAEKQDRKERKNTQSIIGKSDILTPNRMVTVNERETSFEGLIAKFENGEDGIYNMITNDKNIILTPKRSKITEEDLETIPGLRDLINNIEKLEEEFKKASGKRKFLLKKQLIEMHQEQYSLRAAFKQPIYFTNITRSLHNIVLDEKVYLSEDKKEIIAEGFSLLKPEVVSALLCNYQKLKEASWGKFKSDSYYLLLDLENLIIKTLKKDYPLYLDLLIYKVEGLSNDEIQVLLERDHNVKHSVEYISSLWRKKIPKMLAEQAQKDWLIWYYTQKERGKWKRCSRCGQIKLAHNVFFSKNSTSKDGFYSICKDCRNAKTKEKKNKK